MSDFRTEIDAALGADKPIAKDDVMRWTTAADDIYTLSKL